jgi:hypothetical protein
LFEEQLGVHLPDEYVRLLIEAGSAAGPDYGLFAPGKVLAEIELWNGIHQREGRLSTPECDDHDEHLREYGFAGSFGSCSYCAPLLCSRFVPRIETAEPLHAPAGSGETDDGSYLVEASPPDNQERFIDG